MTNARQERDSALGHPSDAPKGLAVLIPGLNNPPGMMAAHARRLRRAGYLTMCVGYRQRRYGLAEAVDCVRDAIPETDLPVHLIGHSLGGLVAATIADERPPATLASVVTIGAPFRGSKIADRVHRIGLGRVLLGAIAADLRPRARAPYEAMAMPGPVAIGAIAGVMPGTTALGRPTDGTVLLAETRSNRLTDHIALAGTHASLLVLPSVTRQIRAFMETLSFARRVEAMPVALAA